MPQFDYYTDEHPSELVVRRPWTSRSRTSTKNNLLRLKTLELEIASLTLPTINCGL